MKQLKPVNASIPAAEINGDTHPLNNNTRSLRLFRMKPMRILLACLTASIFHLVLYQMIYHNLPIETFWSQLIDPNIPLLGCNASIDSHEGMNPNNYETEIKRQFFNFSSDLEDCNPISVPSDLFIPIFVLSRDRVCALQKAVESYQQTFATPYEIIILDHNSTYPPMLEYYKRKIQEKHFTVHFLRSVLWKDALRESSVIIDQYMKAHPHAEYYVFTDNDISFYHTRSDTLLYFAANLASCPKIELVGPALKLSDIPAHYKDRTPEGFWNDRPNLATWKGIGYHVVKHPLDTTFAMRRRETVFSRSIDGTNTLRAYAPYVATHTDWYLDSSNLPEDKVWYVDHLGVNRDINHH